MREQKARKLAGKYGIPLELALGLVDAGFDGPHKIAAAKVADLQRVGGIGPATAKKLKGR